MSEREEEEHHARTVRRGEKFKIELQSNPSTGYSWHLVFFDKSILELISSEFVPNISTQIGSASIQQFDFEAIKEGTTSIKFINKRAWQREAMKSNEFLINVL
jgi:inhibitor of cysteine peptidase